MDGVYGSYCFLFFCAAALARTVAEHGIQDGYCIYAGICFERMFVHGETGYTPTDDLTDGYWLSNGRMDT